MIDQLIIDGIAGMVDCEPIPPVQPGAGPLAEFRPRPDAISRARGRATNRRPASPMRPPPGAINATPLGRGEVTLCVYGQLDRIGLARLRTELAGWRNAATPRLRLDVSAMSGWDPGLARALVWARYQLLGLGQDLILTGAPARLHRGSGRAVNPEPPAVARSPPRQPGLSARDSRPTLSLTSVIRVDTAFRRIDADTHPRRCVMLSDRDREALDEIQQGLMNEDPQFTGTFERTARDLAVRGPGARRTALTVMLVIALMLTVLMIVVHAAGPALFFTAVACWLIWLKWGRPARDGPQRS